MSVDDFLSWSERQAEGRYELSGGDVVAMSPETVRHALTKQAINVALLRAVEQANLGCKVYPDGVGIVIDEKTVREPDVSVQCSPADPDSLTIDEPVIVVEVLSPSSIRTDSIAKVDEYFRVASVRHYLIVDPFNRLVIQFGRDAADAAVQRSVITEGEIALSPPGISVACSAFFDEVER
jgi:Uma2 family endonuclease